MATSGSIAEELFQAIRLRDYCPYVNKLNRADQITLGEFQASDLSKQYTVDTRICYVGRKLNVKHIYEIFGEFSNSDADTVKVSMLKEIADNFNWYEGRGAVFLSMLSSDLGTWLSNMYKSGTRCDELGIYALSHLYDRHTVIFGKGRPWCTIRATGDPAESNFKQSCQLHLLYVGKNIFAPLTPIRDSDMMDKEFEDKIKTVLYGRPPINFLPQNDDDTTYIEVTHVEPGLGNIPVHAHTTVTATPSDDTATTSIAVTSQISTTASGNTIQTVTAATSSNPDSNTTPTMISSNTDSIITPENEHYMLPLNRECFVQIRRLTNEDIQMYKPLPKPLSESSSEDTEDDSESLLTGMTLRKWTTDSTPVRRARAAKKNVDYKGQDESGSDESTEPEKKATEFETTFWPI